ncbi:hypothetical protein ACE4ZZ_16575, partial [Enterococcus casseliflavus]
FLLLSFSIILPYLIVDLKLCNRTVDRVILATDLDKNYLALKQENCIGLTQNWAYLDDGQIFEYTEIHFAPEQYVRTRFIGQKVGYIQ